jgi:hypothetical protein
MERVAFLIELTGERLGCLLNPESLVARRHAGVEPRRSAGGKLTGAALSDDPLLYTGGGRTELLLDLLFDVTIAGSTILSDDVRDLTSPLWNLTENALAGGNGYGRPPLVRFVWGKSWNIPGVVTAVAERLEQFAPTGTPHRSWLRMKLVRVAEKEATSQASGARMLAMAKAPVAGVADYQVAIHRVLGAGGEGVAGERLEDIAFLYYGDPSAWRLIASFNGIADPARIPAGTLLRIPPQSVVAGDGG